MQNYINHIALLLDASGSMNHLVSTVSQVADQQIDYLAKRSKELDQETRVTVYSFSGRGDIECLVYDKDVLRLPSIKNLYRSKGGMTALIDATIKALDDLNCTAQLYGDHAFLTYVLTDGAENASSARPESLGRILKALKDNWTTAVFVPNQNGVFEAKKFGFLPENISVWDTSAKGVQEVGEVIRRTSDTFMTGRARGVRGYKNLFTLDTASLNRSNVQAATKLGPGQFRLIDVSYASPIAEYIEDRLHRPYRIGEAYYELTKKETIQPQKNVALYDRKNHSVFTGRTARNLLGLPGYDVKVDPVNVSEYAIFVQSTSVNRKLLPGTRVLVLS